MKKIALIVFGILTVILLVGWLIYPEQVADMSNDTKVTLIVSAVGIPFYVYLICLMYKESKRTKIFNQEIDEWIQEARKSVKALEELEKSIKSLEKPYPKPIKSGQVAIPEERVKFNNMGWNQFDFFAYELRVLLGVEAAMYAGWYAWKLEGGSYHYKGGVYYFRWTYGGDWELSDRYLKGLKADGWTLARTNI